MTWEIKYDVDVACLDCGALISKRGEIVSAPISHHVTGERLRVGDATSATLGDVVDSYVTIQEPEGSENVIMIEAWSCRQCNSLNWCEVEFGRDAEALRLIGARTVPMSSLSLCLVNFMYADFDASRVDDLDEGRLERLVSILRDSGTVASRRRGDVMALGRLIEASEVDPEDVVDESPDACDSCGDSLFEYAREIVVPSVTSIGELESLAREVEQLSSSVSDPLLLSLRRRRLLVELDAWGLLGEGHRVALGGEYRIIQTYAGAAKLLWGYYRAGVRGRYPSLVMYDRLTDGLVSMDWFRKPSGYVPVDYVRDPQGWLALCESIFAGLRPAPRGVGSVWLRLAGRIHKMEYRPEISAKSCLVRVVPG